MDELIYNQRRIPKDQWRYGLRTSAATGCGWIATHNVLRLMGLPSEPEELIREYKNQLPLIHGNTGTSLFGVFRYFQKRGFHLDLILRKKKFDDAVRAADTAILFYRWRSRKSFGAHFVALHDTDEGFVGYNTYRTSTGPDHYGDSLSGFLKKRKYFGAILMTIQNPGGVRPRQAIYPAPVAEETEEITPAPAEMDENTPAPVETEVVSPVPTETEVLTAEMETTV